jgi:hypothetical protein
MGVVLHYHHHDAVGLVLFFVDSKVDFLQVFVTSYKLLIVFDECDILHIFATQAGVLGMQRYLLLCHFAMLAPLPSVHYHALK